jgi:hypothetical protein
VEALNNIVSTDSDATGRITLRASLSAPLHLDEDFRIEGLEIDCEGVKSEINIYVDNIMIGLFGPV